jgi:hypothetical protein
MAYTNKFILKLESDNFKSDLNKTQASYSKTMDDLAKSTNKATLAQNELRRAKLELKTLTKGSQEYTSQQKYIRNLDLIVAKEKNRVAGLRNFATSQRASIEALKTKISIQQESLSSTKKNTTATKKNTTAIEKNTSEALKTKISTQQKSLSSTKKNTTATKKNTTATKKNTRAISNNGKSLVRHIREMESYIVALYAAKKAYDITLGRGFEYNKLIERETIGLKLLIAQNLQDIDSKGKRVSALEKFEYAQTEANKAMREARAINVETPHTLGETLQIYKLILPQVLKVGGSLEEVSEITKGTSILASAMGVEFQQLLKTVDSLMSGQMKESGLKRALALIGIEQTKVREILKENGDLTGFFIDKLKNANVAGKEFSVSWEGVTSKVKNEWDEIFGQIQKPIFDSLKSDLTDFANYLKQNKEEIISTGIEFTNSFVNFTKTIIEIRSEIALLAELFFAYKVGGWIGQGVSAVSGSFFRMGNIIAGGKARLLTLVATQKLFNSVAMKNPYLIAGTAIIYNLDLIIDRLNEALGLETKRAKLINEWEQGQEKRDLDKTKINLKQQQEQYNNILAQTEKLEAEIANHRELGNKKVADALQQGKNNLEFKKESLKEDIEYSKQSLEYYNTSVDTTANLSEKLGELGYKSTKDFITASEQLAELNKINLDFMHSQNIKKKELYELDQKFKPFLESGYDEVKLQAQEQFEKEKQKIIDKYNKKQTQKIKKATKENIEYIETSWDQSTKNIYQSWDQNFFNAITGKFSSFKDFLRSFFKDTLSSIVTPYAKSLSSTLSSALGNTIGLDKVNVSQVASSLGLNLVKDKFIGQVNGSQVEISKTGEILKGSTAIPKNIQSLLSNTSNANKNYLTAIQSSIQSPFTDIGNFLGKQGFIKSGTFVNMFGTGLTNPFSSTLVPQVGGWSSVAGAGAGLGQIATGAGVGYLAGTLGDKLFGADTKASNYGAIGAGIGTAILPGIGTAIGAGLGSLVGGMFGKTQTTDYGIEFIGESSADDFYARKYTDKKKKSWFKTKRTTEYEELSSSMARQINQIFETYDNILEDFEIFDRRVSIQGAKYSKDTFQSAIATDFFKQLVGAEDLYKEELTKTGIMVYDFESAQFKELEEMRSVLTLDGQKVTQLKQVWEDYARSIDKELMVALSESFANLQTSKREFDLWSISFSGDTIGTLEKSMEYGLKDLNIALKNIGDESITTENYLNKMNQVLKDNPTPELITEWTNLGDILKTSATATRNYNNALQEQQLTSYTSTFSSLGAIQDINSRISLAFIAIAEKQQEISLEEQGITEEKLSSLKQQKEAIQDFRETIISLSEEIRGRYTTVDQQSYLSSYELLRSQILAGDYSGVQDFRDIAIDYANNIEKTAKTSYESNFSLAKMANDIKLLPEELEELDYVKDIDKNIDYIEDHLRGIETTAKDELDILEVQYQALLDEKDILVSNSLAELSKMEELWGGDSTIVSLLRQTLSDIGVDPSAGWSMDYSKVSSIASSGSTTALPANLGSDIGSTTANNAKITNATESLVNSVYKSVLGRSAEQAGLDYWVDTISSGQLAVGDLNTAIATAALDYKDQDLTYFKRYKTGGYTGDGNPSEIAGLVDKGEFVVNAPTTRVLGLNRDNGGIFVQMANELKTLRQEVQQLKQLNIKQTATSTKQLQTQRALLSNNIKEAS